jgi:hypothetical protein
MPEGAFTDQGTGHLPDDPKRGYVVDIADSFDEYCTNAAFRQLLDDGRFIFIAPGYLVINDPRYVACTEQGPALTEYAKAHIAECCLRFKQRLGQEGPEGAAGGAADAESTAGRAQAPGKERRHQGQTTVFNPSRHNMTVFNRSRELRRFYDELMEDGRFAAETSMTFAQLVAAFIRRKGYNRQVFTEKTGLSTRTYNRIMDNELPAPSLDTVMAICIGLQLGSGQSERLLEAAGYKLNASPLHMAYRKLLATHIGHPLEACNEVLAALALPPIRTRGHRNDT